MATEHNENENEVTRNKTSLTNDLIMAYTRKKAESDPSFMLTFISQQEWRLSGLLERYMTERRELDALKKEYGIYLSACENPLKHINDRSIAKFGKDTTIMDYRTGH